MSDNFEKSAEQGAAFQKIWMESMSKLMQSAFTLSPNSPPPDVLKQIRSGIFEALARSWEEFMRSPQFLEGMKQWMENAIQFRNVTNDFMARVRNEMQAPSREDMDTIMLAVRHIEKRVLDRVEELSQQIDEIRSKGGARRRPKPATPTGNGKRRVGRAFRKARPAAAKTGAG